MDRSWIKEKRDETLSGALTKGQKALSEFESKRFLSSRGILVSREFFVQTTEEAAAAVKKIGYPVALKACGAALSHKSELGALALNVKGAREVRKEGACLLKVKECEGLLVQEMVRGDREFGVGLTRHSRFGPCIMFGVGGGSLRPKSRESWAHFFEPKSVAVIGASSVSGKPGHDVVRNILANEYAGRVYLVNPKGGEILGVPAYQTVSALPEGIDLAVVIVSADKSPQTLRECIAKGIRHVVLAAGGFAELDRSGAEIQKELAALIRENGIHALGPNTSGHVSTPHKFTSTFSPWERSGGGTSLTSPRPVISQLIR